MAKRRDTWSGVKELLACDISSSQINYFLCGGKNSNLKFMGYTPSQFLIESSPASRLEWAGLRETSESPKWTIEFREARGSMDAEWVATWAKIVTRVVTWARDVDCAEMMRVIGRIAEEEGKVEKTYDVVDLLVDLGMPAEARFCDERLRKGDKARLECLVVDRWFPPMPPWVEDMRIWGKKEENCGDDGVGKEEDKWWERKVEGDEWWEEDGEGIVYGEGEGEEGEASETKGETKESRIRHWLEEDNGSEPDWEPGYDGEDEIDDEEDYECRAEVEQEWWMGHMGTAPGLPLD